MKQNRFSFNIPSVTIINSTKLKHSKKRKWKKTMHQSNNTISENTQQQFKTERNENNGIAYCEMDCAFSGCEATYFAKKGSSKNYKEKTHKVAQPSCVHYEV